MADSQAQPSWISSLMQGLLGKIGLTGAAAQGGPAQAPATPAQNPWVQSVAPSTANDPNAIAQGQQQQQQSMLQRWLQMLSSKNSPQGQQGQ